jgi:hypothetical protein
MLKFICHIRFVFSPHLQGGVWGSLSATCDAYIPPISPCPAVPLTATSITASSPGGINKVTYNFNFASPGSNGPYSFSTSTLKCSKDSTAQVLCSSLSASIKVDTASGAAALSAAASGTFTTTGALGVGTGASLGILVEAAATPLYDSGSANAKVAMVYYYTPIMTYTQGVTTQTATCTTLSLDSTTETKVGLLLLLYWLNGSCQPLPSWVRCIRFEADLDA